MCGYHIIPLEVRAHHLACQSSPSSLFETRFPVYHCLHQASWIQGFYLYFLYHCMDTEIALSVGPGIHIWLISLVPTEPFSQPLNLLLNFIFLCVSVFLPVYFCACECPQRPETELQAFIRILGTAKFWAISPVPKPLDFYKSKSLESKTI